MAETPSESGLAGALRLDPAFALLVANYAKEGHSTDGSCRDAGFPRAWAGRLGPRAACGRINTNMVMLRTVTLWVML